MHKNNEELARFSNALYRITPEELSLVQQALHSLLENHTKWGIEMPHEVWNTVCEAENAVGTALQQRQQ